MQIEGSKTEEHLKRAFARELQANASYMYFADSAREAGLEQIADIFLATAKNEAEHAEHEFRFIHGVSDTVESLKQAINAEHHESGKFYPEAALVAEQEGFTEIANFFHRMSKVEGRHEEYFQQLLEALNKGEVFKERTVGHSAITMAQVMYPAQANTEGYVHGGELMKFMDNVAGVVARRHCRSNVVTASAQDISFHKSILVGDLVIIYGKLTFVSGRSMEVLLEVESESRPFAERTHALTAHFVLVALDKDGKAMEVPPLLLSTEEEQKLFDEGQERYRVRKGEG